MISLQSKGLSRVFSSTSLKAFSLLYSANLTSIHDYWKNHSFDYVDLCWQAMSLLFRRNQAHAPQPLSPRAANTKASTCSKAHKPQLLIHVLQCLKPVHLEPVLCNKRSHCDDHSEKSRLTTTRKARMQQRRHTTPKLIINKKSRNKKGCYS